MVEAEGELVGVGDDFGGGGVGIGAVGAGGEIGKRIAGEDGGNSRVDGDLKRVGGVGAVRLLIADGILHDVVFA